MFDELRCYGVPLKQAMNSGAMMFDELRATVFDELRGYGVR